MTITVAAFATPAGTQVPSLTGTAYNAPFTNTALLTANPGPGCGPGEYRQFVKGSFTANGSVLSHSLCGNILLRTDIFQEDGCPSGNCTAYGHRACPAGPMDRYTPTQAQGGNFTMYDAPGFTNVSRGSSYSIALDFTGRIIDTTLGNQVLAERAWRVAGAMTIPSIGAAMTATRPVPLQAADKVLMAIHAVNAESGVPEVHVVVHRPAGSPPLGFESGDIVLQDAAGKTVPQVAPPMVHEISSKAHSTANIVLRPDPAARVSRVSLTHDGTPLVIAIRAR